MGNFTKSIRAFPFSPENSRRSPTSFHYCKNDRERIEIYAKTAKICKFRLNLCNFRILSQALFAKCENDSAKMRKRNFWLQP